MRRSRLVPLALALALGGACVPPVPGNDQVVRFDEETVMGRIQASGQLRVGFPVEVRAPWASLEGGFASGFAADVARDLADSLDVEPAFYAEPNAELIDRVTNGRLDIAFPLTTVTEELVRKHAFSDPVLVAHQRLLVPSGSGIEDVADVDGEVCSPIDETTGIELQALNPAAATLPLKPGDADGCVPLLEDGLADLATAPDVMLATMLEQLGSGFEVTGDQLTTEPLAAALESGAPAWVDYVNKVITEFDQEGRWTASYEEHLAPLLGGETPEPTNMTLEEAAALFPADLEED